ncbi:odorant receptor 13a-like [Prorops nasuta]|uniref:odorant receptor 13a-like n=1 Tax=Prorops nasuta TaxID=863751 RepID=UPI0034CEE7CC
MNVNDYVLINRKILGLVGLYPFNMPKYILCVACMFLIIIPQVVQIYQAWQNLSVVLETSSVLLTIILAVLKSFIWMLKRKTLGPFITFMLEDYWKIVQTNFTRKTEAYATMARKITKGYLFLICNALLFFFTLPLGIMVTDSLNGKETITKHFPFLATYPLSWYQTPMYELVYLSQIFATCTCGLIILGTDTLIATAMFHTCGHFQILQNKILGLDEINLKTERISNRYESFIKQDSKDKIKQEIIRIIKHHQVVLWFYEKMEEQFSPMMFLQTLASSLIICLVGVQVSTTLTYRSKIMEYASYLCMALFQLLLFCFPGDELMNQSFSLNKRIYSIKWYDHSAEIKFIICILMLRNQKPCNLTAAKFYVMHLKSFGSILSTSLSYFMVLRSFNS